MTVPKLDGRGVKDLLREIKKKSEFYTPEWRYDPEHPDAGGALAQIFAEMFYETIDRVNRFPDKCYLEFLNMQGVSAKPVSPAVGMAAAELVEGASVNVSIPKGTQLFTDLTDPTAGDMRVVFETNAGFAATPANLTALYMTDPVKDIITRTELSEDDAFPIILFAPKPEDNIERHRFAVSNDAVLRLAGQSEIRVKITHTGMAFRIAEDLAKLSDASFAKWSVSDGTNLHPLDVRQEEDCLILTKKDEFPIVRTDLSGVPDENGNYWLFCDMVSRADADDIVVDGILLASRSLVNDDSRGGILPERLFAQDTELDIRDCGCCFGREPNVYDSFYIACDEAFSKRGAQITMEFDVSTVIVQDPVSEEGPVIDFNQKLLIDKEDAKTRPYDDIRISEIVWEYWNGLGWARLDVSGDVNPFSCQEEAERRTIRFVCPDNFGVSMQNAYEGLWMRARIRGMDNRFSTHARWLLPYLRRMGIRFDYGEETLNAEHIFTSNSCTDRQYEPMGASMEMRLFGRMAQKHHALYFRFDSQPHGYPVNLYFDLIGRTGIDRVLSFEYLCRDHTGRASWNEVKAVDRTHGFENSGIASLYLPGDFAEAELFGENGFWVRVINRSMQYNPDAASFPKLAGITKNTVEITQRQSVRGELHEVLAGKPDQTVVLANRPVIDCEVWINELPETPLGELRKMAEADRSRVRMVTDAEGTVSECWVRWDTRVTLADTLPEERCCVLDATAAVIRFGDGVRGKIPGYQSGLQVSVDYSFGGGSRGNLPAGALDGLIVSIPYVESMTNLFATCGGSDEQSIDTVRKIGPMRLKNSGRAVTAEDFESLVLEEFNEIEEVRCFTNRNRSSEKENGSVTVVVTPHDFDNVSYTFSLCRRVEEFLRARAGCELTAGGRLTVITAVPMKVSAQVSVTLDDYDNAAQTEAEIIAAVNAMLQGGGERIGVVPRISDVMTALKKLPNIALISRVLLTGEYYLDNELITVPLDGAVEYRYFVAVNGTHTVKI